MTAPSVGLIGAGTWGRNLVRALAALGELGGIADLDEGHLEAARALAPGVATTHDSQAIIDGPTVAVAIATSAPTHEELALRALAAGKHVFVEKPLALSVRGAEAIAHAAKAAHRHVFVGHLLLYHPAILALQEAIRRGAVGEVTHVRSRRLSPGRIRTNEDVWWSFAPHDVSLVLSLLGEPTAASAGGYAYVQPGIVDFAYADLRFARGLSAHIEVSWLDPNKSSRIDVFGSAGIASVETACPVPTLVTRTFGTERPAGGVMPSSYAPAESRAFPHSDALRDELQAFLTWIRGGPAPPTDAAHGVRVVRTLAAVSSQMAIAAEPAAVAR